MSDRVTITYQDDIAQVRLNRPDKMNALDQAMFDAIIAAQVELAASDVRAVVLAGEGRAFCAGLDMARFAQLGRSGELAVRSHGMANQVQQLALGWRGLPMPVIAAVHGVCFGGGLQIMLGADIRLVAPDTRLAILEAKWGLVPDMAGIALTRTLVRDDVLRELTYTGREFSGVEAVGFGLATRTSADPLAEATALAQAIAQRSPDATRAAKRLYALAVDAGTATILQAETDEQVALIGAANQLEAVTAAMEKRPARFG